MAFTSEGLGPVQYSRRRLGVNLDPPARHHLELYGRP